MAGHSKFKNIMHRKGAQDAKRAKKFARLTKELQVAVRGGTDPSSCLLYTSPSPRDGLLSRMPSSA